MQPPPMPPPAAAAEEEEEHDEDLVPHPPSQQRTKPEPEPEPELEPVVAAATNSTHAVAFDGADAAPLTFSVNHFGLRGRRAGPGVKRGDFVTTWRERYFVLHEDGNFLVYFLSASESEPRGALPLGGGTVEATDDRDGCGLRLKLRGTGENLLAFDTTAERDAWLQVLQQASAEAYVDSIANRALLPLLPTLPARAQSVFFGAPGALARHTLGTGLMPEDWAASSELVRTAAASKAFLAARLPERAPRRSFSLARPASAVAAAAAAAASARCGCLPDRLLLRGVAYVLRAMSIGVCSARMLNSSGSSVTSSSARRKDLSVSNTLQRNATVNKSNMHALYALSLLSLPALASTWLRSTYGGRAGTQLTRCRALRFAPTRHSTDRNKICLLVS